jgi:hypothetical protein
LRGNRSFRLSEATADYVPVIQFRLPGKKDKGTPETE